jgi:hypothetical protein
LYTGTIKETLGASLANISAMVYLLLGGANLLFGRGA